MDKKRKEELHDDSEPAIKKNKMDIQGTEEEKLSAQLSENQHILDTPDALKKDLKEKFLFSFPDKFFGFWEYVQTLNKGKADNPCCTFHELNALRLCGVFDYLAGNVKDLEQEAYLLHSRHDTDLPEMQPLALYDGGRFVYWRDNPDTEEPLIVHVTNLTHFPKCSIVGVADPFYMISHLIGPKLPSNYNWMFSQDWIDHYSTYIHKAETAISLRKQRSVGSPAHGLRLRFEIVSSVGYRPLLVPSAQVLETLTILATPFDKEVKRREQDRLVDVLTRVQLANDEKDYGMGLELGHDLFLSNYAYFDKLAEEVLNTAYSLLNYPVFSTILKIHMRVRRKHSD